MTLKLMFCFTNTCISFTDPYASTTSGAEEIEFSRLDADTSEISALASFAKKVAAD